MGTNFYTVKSNLHIGKRSAAGLYCWDCKKTLCEGGEEKIHTGLTPFLTCCPVCGKNRPDPAAFIALLTKKPNNTRNRFKVGITPCASFTYAMDKDLLDKKVKKEARKKVVVDDCGQKYTYKQFMALLKECPIIFEDKIGLEFC